ncbi:MULTISPECIES: hypothetical protein [Sphingomonas]|uniref:hypothetical protein n=1 Tax=Sphingomonas TaxID=13687 RepID=UPI001269BDC0|nr:MULTISPECIES: hypothetical protein [Sphingomonas]
MSDRKGFYVTLINDDRRPDALRLYAIGYGDEAAQPRVMLPSPILTLPANSQRRVLVIASDLSPGETFRFRVCAERADFGQGALIHARVCSKLVARRIG